MTVNFPDSPAEEELFTYIDRVWQYVNGTWLLVPYQSASTGLIDGGTPYSDYPVSLNGGAPPSAFSKLVDTNAGGV